VQIISEKIPEGSYEVRIWKDGDDWRSDPICTVLNLKPHENEPSNAVVSMAHGKLSNEINIMIGLEAVNLGFKHLTWYVAKGDRVSRWANFVRSDGVYDWYTVDLEEAVKQLEVQNGRNNR
jgi:hypothetical protein